MGDEQPAPLWRPPRVVQHFVDWLRSLRGHRLAAVAAISAAASLLLSLARRRRGEAMAVLEAPVSALLKAVERGQVAGATLTATACAYQLGDGRQFWAQLLPHDSKLLVKLLHAKSVPFRAQGPPGWKALGVMLVPFAYLGACGWLVWKMQNDAFGGREKGPEADEGRTLAVNWKDVAGVPKAKEAVMEVVDVLRRPERYAALGARCPRGILLAGPPGTGKTLLARAVATEAGVPFLSCAGSDFVEVYVGRGARRVRSLFEDAQKRAPCVVFIDELDAIGSARRRALCLADGSAKLRAGEVRAHLSLSLSLSFRAGGRLPRQARSGRGGGTEEHDHTLNQLLAEMDGVSAHTGVLVMGATNRLGLLDKALTRPGRFDRVLQVRRDERSLPRKYTYTHYISLSARVTL